MNILKLNKTEWFCTMVTMVTTIGAGFLDFLYFKKTGSSLSFWMYMLILSFLLILSYLVFYRLITVCIRFLRYLVQYYIISAIALFFYNIFKFNHDSRLWLNLLTGIVGLVWFMIVAIKNDYAD